MPQDPFPDPGLAAASQSPGQIPGSFACITGVLRNGEQIPLFRLRYGGSAHSSGFAIHSAASDHLSARTRGMAAVPALSVIHSPVGAWIDAGRAAAAREGLWAARPILWTGSHRQGLRQLPQLHRRGGKGADDEVAYPVPVQRGDYGGSVEFGFTGGLLVAHA
jgi:hypothetical protein